MDFVELLLITNILLGLLAFLMFVKLKEELFIRDLIPGVFIILFGILTFWFWFYEMFQKPIHKFLLGLGEIGNIRLWRSRSKITQEVLYGKVHSEEEEE